MTSIYKLQLNLNEFKSIIIKRKAEMWFTVIVYECISMQNYCGTFKTLNLILLGIRINQILKIMKEWKAHCKVYDINQKQTVELKNGP